MSHKHVILNDAKFLWYVTPMYIEDPHVYAHMKPLRHLYSSNEIDGQYA
jgi:hypothetical protein